MKKSFFFLLCIALWINGSGENNGAWDNLHQAAQKHLVNLINIDTAQPTPNERAAARYIYKELNKHHIDWDIFIPSKNHANLVARIKGTNPSKKPLLLISHLDTVPAQEGWTVPPFKATLKDGRIYGLGATDAKNYTATHLALFTWLATQQTRPQRDIIFLVTSGEENGSKTGLLWLLDTHWDKVNPGFALSEGGGIIDAPPAPPLVFVEGATKQYMDIKITATGEGGHASIPLQDNAVYGLSQALAKIAAYNPPAKLTPVAQNFFKAIMPLQTEDGKTTLEVLLSGEPENQQNAAEIMAQDAFLRTQLKDTVTPTELAASKEANTTSKEASALLNARLLPGTDPDEFFTQLTQLFTQDENISLEIVERPQTPPAPVMDGKDELFAAIRKTANTLLPGAITAVGMSPASGDSEFLRKSGIITYGLGPKMYPSETNSAHNTDEFIYEKDLFEQLDFLAGVVFNFAYEKDLLPLLAPPAPAKLQDDKANQ